ncbi:olfactory receptor class A-like protein 1 [Phyllobates terribilis]|uniref:olfactory receptor class A-like protein 1 n=1 Tax=Phyllobates terribilis TaxID=111132 RepID=UPI003CCAEAD6
MDPRVLLKASGFLFLMVIGIPGNVFILIQFICLKIIEKKLLPANIMLVVLALANLLVLFSRVLPQSLEAIGLSNLLSDTECMLIIYTYRVSRAMCIAITSMLSCHQCILIAPNSRGWFFLKQKVSQNMSILISTVWLIILIMYPYSMSISRAKGNFTTSPFTLHVVFCNIDFKNYFSYILNGAFMASRDFIFVGLMTLASGYIVYLLINHERTVREIRSLDKRKRKSVEYKASRAVIVLVVLYVVLFGLDNSMWIYTLTMSNVSPEMNDARIMLACSYSAISLLVIIATNQKLQQRQNGNQLRLPFCYTVEGQLKVNKQKSYYPPQRSSVLATLLPETPLLVLMASSFHSHAPMYSD